MTLCRASVLSLVFLASPVYAQAAEVAAPAASVDCAAPRWVLDGAKLRVENDNGAAFRAEWKPQIDAIAGCFRAESFARACASVQGHADDATFDKRVSGAFGGEEAAQLSRARGRALEVLAELYKSGIPADRLKELPPARGSNIRGVEVALVPDCVKPVPTQVAGERGPTAVELQVLVRDSVTEANAQREAEQEAARKEQFRVLREALKPFIDGALVGTLTGFEPSTALGSTVGPSVGARFHFIYARLDTAFGLATPDASRMAFEFGAAAGWYAHPALQLGVVVSNRFSAPNPAAPWLDQAWAFGLEGTHCLAKVARVDLCLTETVRPVGVRTQRGTVIDGAAVRLPETQGWSMRFDLGVRARFGF